MRVKGIYITINLHIIISNVYHHCCHHQNYSKEYNHRFKKFTDIPVGVYLTGYSTFSFMLIFRLIFNVSHFRISIFYISQNKIEETGNSSSSSDEYFPLFFLTAWYNCILNDLCPVNAWLARTGGKCDWQCSICNKEL